MKKNKVIISVQGAPLISFDYLLKHPVEVLKQVKEIKKAEP